MKRGENSDTPKVMGGVLYTNEGGITVESAGWYAWLWRGETFYFEGTEGTFTARSELQSGIRYWYAYRRQAGKLHKRYLGKSEKLNLERMNTIAKNLSSPRSKLPPVSLELEKLRALLAEAGCLD